MQINVCFESHIIHYTAKFHILDDLYFTGVTLSPCGDDGLQEILADHETRFTCESGGHVEWELQYYNNHGIHKDSSMTTILLAECDTMCTAINTFDELFTFSVINNHTTAMIIKPVNNTQLYNNVQLLNGSVECKHTNEKMKDVCGLHYIGKCVYTSIVSMSKLIYKHTTHSLKQTNVRQNYVFHFFYDLNCNDIFTENNFLCKKVFFLVFSPVCKRLLPRLCVRANES